MRAGALNYFKLVVLLLVPVLGVVYAYQFTGQSRELIVPFKVFRSPEVEVQDPRTGASLKIPFEQPINVVNFWATWCPPCVEEFPAMIELQRQLEGKGVALIFVSIDEDWSKVEEFHKANQIPFWDNRMFWDPKREAATAFGSTKFPETYVIRQDGWVLEKIVGLQQWLRPVVIEYFESLGGGSKVSQLFLGPLDLLISSSNAQSDSSSLGVETLIHEQDKKTLERLRKNIETANENLQKTEGALREEERSLAEQKIVVDLRRKEESESQLDLSQVQKKVSEVDGLLKRTVEGRRLEELEKIKIEGEIKAIQSRIRDLERRLDAAKDELSQANKGLNTRLASIETFEKAKETNESEIETLKGQAKRAGDVLKSKRMERERSEKELSRREKKRQDLAARQQSAAAALEQQKAKLLEFEALLKK